MSDAYLNSLLGDREEIILVTRKHWFVLVQATLFECTLLVVIVSLIPLIRSVELPRILITLTYFFPLIPVIGLLRDGLYWYHHKYIVTNRRVIQIAGVFNKHVIDSSLEKVNDVRMEQSFLGRLFGFGNIEILTASELGVNRFMRIGDPIHFKTAMLNAKRQLEQDAAAPRERPDADIPSLLTQLDALRKQGVLTEEEFQKKKTELLAKL